MGMVRNLYGFIINQVSGNGKALRIWSNIEKVLLEKKVPYIYKITERSGHATTVVQQFLNTNKVTNIVGIGGDGTIQEIVNALAGTNVPLGVIPAGSGNDFARGLGIPKNYEKALNRILTEKPKLIDLGLIDTTYFCTVVGIGIDGEVAKKANSSLLKKVLNYLHLGQLSYIASALNVLVHYKPKDITLVIDQKRYNIPKVWLVAIANTPYYGGGLNICPEADCNDGLLDICIVHGMSKWELICTFPLTFTGKHLSSPSITLLKGKEIDVYSNSPLTVQAGGEIIGQTPVKMKIEPNSLYII